MRRHHRARRVVQKIGGSESPRWIFAFLLLAACGKTPADAIVPVATGPDGGDGCTDGVSVVSAGLFRLRAASGQCLNTGSPTFVGLSPAHETAMTSDCATSEIWDLKTMTSSVVFGFVYEVAATTFDESLDITMAITADGTAAITFMSTGNPNQEFQFRQRRANVFEIAPVHVLGQTSCLSSQATPAIQRCSAAATDQEWMLIPAECS